MKSFPACLLAVLLCFSAFSRAAEEPLPPEQAYPVSARSVGPAAVAVHIPIVKAYYLYKDKFRFRAEPGSVQIGTPSLPPGQRKQAPYSGDVDVYRGDLTFTLPV